MRFSENNIASHLEKVSSVLDREARFSKQLVEEVYHELYEMPKHIASCGLKRKKSFLLRRYFYTALNILKVLKKEQVHTPGGIVYFIAHPKMPGYVKVGRTQDVEDRLGIYNVGCPNKEYYTRYYTIVDDVISCEKDLHKILSPYRNSGEWFKDDILKSRADCEKLSLEALDGRMLLR
jgi:hypothetical protein